MLPILINYKVTRHTLTYWKLLLPMIIPIWWCTIGRMWWCNIYALNIMEICDRGIRNSLINTVTCFFLIRYHSLHCQSPMPALVLFIVCRLPAITNAGPCIVYCLSIAGNHQYRCLYCLLSVDCRQWPMPALVLFIVCRLPAITNTGPCIVYCLSIAGNDQYRPLYCLLSVDCRQSPIPALVLFIVCRLPAITNTGPCIVYCLSIAMNCIFIPCL